MNPLYKSIRYCLKLKKKKKKRTCQDSKNYFEKNEQFVQIYISHEDWNAEGGLINANV